ncbi:g8703 [Coccomyxa elongata]
MGDRSASWTFVACGQVGLEVVTVNEDGLRGTVAARDVEEGEILAAVPYNCSFELLPGKWGLTGPELAIHLLRRRFEDPTWWSHMQPYAASLPDKSQMYNRHMLLPAHLSLLQDARLEASVRAVLQNVDDVYTGADSVESSNRYTSLAHLPGSATVTRDGLAYLAALMDSYSFNFPNDGDDILRVQLVPLLDLINHGDDTNIALSRDQGSSSYVATALRPIKRGEEVVYQYSWILERNDKALLQYFFVQERNPPLLCLLDLPEHGSFWDTPGRLDDDALYGPGGPLCTEGEVERLNNILVSFPTTEDDDAALLGSENLTDWRERVIVKFRMLRKRALRLTIQGVQLALAQARQCLAVTDSGADKDVHKPTSPDTGPIEA